MRKRARRSRRKQKRRLLPRKRKLQSEDNISRSTQFKKCAFGDVTDGTNPILVYHVRISDNTARCWLHLLKLSY